MRQWWWIQSGGRIDGLDQPDNRHGPFENRIAAQANKPTWGNGEDDPQWRLVVEIWWIPPEE